jgi:death on curing protein
MILTPEKILDVHKLIIRNFGAIDGVLCQDTIDYLVDQINAELDLFRKAALALHIVANCHPFLDGNKRSAFQIAELILSSEGYAIIAKEEVIIQMLLRIASYECQSMKSKFGLRKILTNFEAHISAKRFISFSLRCMLSSSRYLSPGVRPSINFADFSCPFFDTGIACLDMKHLNLNLLV